MTYLNFLSVAASIYINQTCLNMIKARLSAAFQRSCPIRHTVLQNTKMFNHWPNFNTWITFYFYFLTKVLLLDTKPSYFNQEKFDCFKSLPKNFNTVPKPLMDHFGR